MVENLLMYMCGKHCRKRWSSDKAIAKIKRCSFFCLTVYYIGTIVSLAKGNLTGVCYIVWVQFSRCARYFQPGLLVWRCPL